MGQEPRAERPYMPEYGISRSAEGLLTWQWAEERLKASRNYWLATMRPDGRPHVIPVWGVWLDGAFYFSTGARSRKARNLAVNRSCTVTTEDPTAPVILDGTAKRVTDTPSLERLIEVYSVKYDHPLQARDGEVVDDQSYGGPVFLVRPDRAIGMQESDMANSATRWVFD
jgi:hypothetical protein